MQCEPKYGKWRHVGEQLQKLVPDLSLTIDVDASSDLEQRTSIQNWRGDILCFIASRTTFFLSANHIIDFSVTLDKASGGEEKDRWHTSIISVHAPCKCNLL